MNISTEIFVGWVEGEGEGEKVSCGLIMNIGLKREEVQLGVALG